MITPADETLLRRAIDIAAHAVTVGDAPYGSLLAGPDGTILVEAHNTVRRDNDITAHPELKLPVLAYYRPAEGIDRRP